MSDLHPDFDKIKAIDLLTHLHVSPIKIAKWIISKKIEIVGFIDPDKPNLKMKTAAEMDEEEFNRITSVLDRELRAALWAWRQQTDWGGVTNPEEIEHIEQQIDDSLRFLVFDRNSFESLIREMTPSNLMPDRDTNETMPKGHDIVSTAKDEILNYAEKRSENDDPLVAGDFTGNPADKTISAICKEYDVKPDTLRKYVQQSYLLKPSKSGRKPT